MLYSIYACLLQLICVHTKAAIHPANILQGQLYHVDLIVQCKSISRKCPGCASHTSLLSEPPLRKKSTHPPLSSGRPSPECNQLGMRRDPHIGSCPSHSACACGLRPWALDWALSGQQRHPQTACNNFGMNDNLSRLHQTCRGCVTSRAKVTEGLLCEHMTCLQDSKVLCYGAVRSEIQV